MERLSRTTIQDLKHRPRLGPLATERIENLGPERTGKMIALDSNAMTYWIDAMGSVDGPPAEPSRAEKIALTHIFFWMPDTSAFYLTPTVELEYRAIVDPAKLNNHASWALVLLCSLPHRAQNKVAERAAELGQYHSGGNDCRIVSECELGKMDVLLTCDPRLARNLSTRSRNLEIVSPAEYWTRMAVPKGARPQQIPHHTNPMAACDWWHW